jgi:glycerol-3-phosphate dehydrogenase
VLFLVPWPRAWLVGTTDDPDPSVPERPAAQPREVAAILELVNRTLELDLRPEDAVGAYAGLRPLVADAGVRSTVTLSREHRVWSDGSGIVHVAGGKYTTYRLIARDAVDRALEARARHRPSRTHEIPLLGAAPRSTLDAIAGRIAETASLPADVASRLVERHGTEANAIVGPDTGAPSVPLGAGIDELEAEVAWAVREELAMSLDDILARRMRLATLLPDRGASIAASVAQIAGRELGWDAVRQRREVEVYLESAHREYDVPEPVDGPSVSAATASAATASAA